MQQLHYKEQRLYTFHRAIDKSQEARQFAFIKPGLTGRVCKVNRGRENTKWFAHAPCVGYYGLSMLMLSLTNGWHFGIYCNLDELLIYVTRRKSDIGTKWHLSTS